MDLAIKKLLMTKKKKKEVTNDFDNNNFNGLVVGEASLQGFKEK